MMSAHEQKARSQKPTYLELVKASLKADEDLKQAKVNQSKVGSAKSFFSRRSAVPLIVESKTGPDYFSESKKSKKER